MINPVKGLVPIFNFFLKPFSLLYFHLLFDFAPQCSYPFIMGILVLLTNKTYL